MARGAFIASLATALIAALIVLRLASTIQYPSQPLRFKVMPPGSSGRPAKTTDVADDEFLIGVGKADITGPVVELNLMGYANSSQIGTGLRQRIYSRAFIVANPRDVENSFVYLVLDTATGDTAIRDGILQGLASLGGEYGRYKQQNVAVTGTHSHSGPAAWLNYLLPQITSLGFDHQSYNAIVDGALLSIRRAHESMVKGRLSFGSIDVEEGSINRSPYAYLANPAEERGRYDSDVDKKLTLLRFDRLDDSKTIGVLTFFAVHGTSLYGNNTLISGDNKGVAAYLFERSVKGDARFADGFVAGFSQSTVGDTTPNVLGPYCEDGSGLKCKFEDSTCGGKSQPCRGRGPYFRENDAGAKSCFEMGRRQFSAAKKLYDEMDENPTKISGNGDVSAFHTFHNMSNFTFASPFDPSQTLSTCSAALGFSFAGGTTDGPGAFDFTQNGTDSPSKSNPVWYIVRDLLHDPSPEQEKCQEPKTILLDVGSQDKPYAWSPNIVDVQVLRVGQLLIIVSPGEATSMAGRRWKNAISKSAASKLHISDPIVVLGGPANTYAHYITTEEEYGIQRYEGASTLYGPHTLAAHINLTLTHLPYLAAPSVVRTLPPLDPGPSPPINTNNSLSFITPVVLDGRPFAKSFGDVVSSPPEDKKFRPGDKVTTTFVGANPRNNLRLESTFAAVERQNKDSNSWEVVRDDADWTLVYHWKRKNTILGTSEVTLEWLIDDEFYSVGNPRKLESGTYRMRYYGDAKHLGGKIEAFEGVGPSFTVAV
ncbi:hypothetical protein AJ80_00829 [Polytolypa hystricis UAMH7299]|uniref:Neutral ceramidase n=1 Tax=Polytolypa hystricis (strain UAMH7299) TaxID=1447883 RepID=A0A2B7Z432_POLH7|nr:hypothetical protein AJ80_00829 [Polytolypa hystricis UAMH7299]